MNETEAARHQRENERYEKAIKKNTRATRNDEATRLLLLPDSQQALPLKG
ncbi:tail length tape measure protein [Shigella sonnei]|nr:tail length tape measure protein [Shigella sonnei]